MVLHPELVFDGSRTLPCFYNPNAPTPDAAAAALAAVPDTDLVPPSGIAGNDQRSLALIAQIDQAPQKVFACTTSPPGFVCPKALEGEMVKCVPRMDHSDLTQLSAKVLPLTVSRSSSSLDDPSRGDARFEIFPEKYLPVFSRCCNKSFSAPSDIVPMNCRHVDDIVGKRVFSHMHHVSPSDLGFRRANLSQLHLTHAQLKQAAETNWLTNEARMKVWEHEAAQIVPGLFSRFKMMCMPSTVPQRLIRNQFF